LGLTRNEQARFVLALVRNDERGENLFKGKRRDFEHFVDNIITEKAREALPRRRELPISNEPKGDRGGERKDGNTLPDSLVSRKLKRRVDI